LGTKADFYIKRGEELEWRGSIEWDGQEDKIPENILRATNEQEFQENLDAFFKRKPDSVGPDKPWPWHYDSSKFTDFCYIMWEEKGKLVISHFNSQTYTIYQYRKYMERMKADKDNMENFDSYLKKVGDFRPVFPIMNKLMAALKQNTEKK